LKRTSVCIIDYGAGNTGSVVSALRYLGANVKVVAKSEDLDDFDKVILPGVGSFKKAMDNLNAKGLAEKIRVNVLQDKQPILGICLGFQMLFCSSPEEGLTNGLGLMDGKITALKNFIDSSKKVPHVGFNQIQIYSDHHLFNGLDQGADFYFVHSYGLAIDENSLTSFSTTDYGGKFISAIAVDNIMGTQFHPEKSQSNGLILLKNFLEA